MKLLLAPAVPADAVSWRFLRLWLEEWGLAPELAPFHASNGFKSEEISLLSQLLTLPPQEITHLFMERVNPSIRENVFKVASNLAKTFLNEK